jgi:glycosyltransferase involved in cell wall biosynthesis
LMESIARLYDQQGLREDLGHGARRRVEAHYTWAQKSELIRDIYARARSNTVACARLPVRESDD